MAKVFKAVIYITDYNDQLQNKEHFTDELLRVLDRLDTGVHIAEANESGYFEWDDDLLINKRDAETEDFEVYLED